MAVDGEVVELDAGTTKARILMSHDDASSLMRAPLVAAVFNMKGRPHPIGGHFKDSDDWEAEADRQLARMREQLAHWQRRDVVPLLLPARGLCDTDVKSEDPTDAMIQTLTAEIAKIEQQRAADAQPRGRVAMVPCERKHGAADVIQLRFVPAEHEFVTHIVLGARQPDGTIRVLGGAAFSAPIVVLADAMVRIGLRVTAGLAPAAGERLTLPAAFKDTIDGDGLPT